MDGLMSLRKADLVLDAALDASFYPPPIYPSTIRFSVSSRTDIKIISILYCIVLPSYIAP